MITINLTGGLGNQLFQYALGRYLAIKWDAELVIDDTFYKSQPTGVTPRRYELDKFATQLRIVTDSERRYLKRYTNRYLRYLQKYISLPSRYKYVREPLDKLLLEVRDLSGDLFLDGFWQSERYFAGVEDIIRHDLIPNFDFSDQEKEVMASMQNTASVSLHVRRGDYVTNPLTSAWHGICGLDYYRDAIGVIESRIESPHYFVFSDDMAWATANLQIDKPVTYVSHNDETTAVNDLMLMASCQHHIIANSSFSWWGAWLNPKKEKWVVRPKMWLEQLPHMNDSVCPESWVAV